MGQSTRSCVVAAAVVALFACKKDETGGPPGPRGAPPPPADSSAAKPDACKSGGGEVKDPVSSPFFARRIGTYCINPEGETKAFGDKAPKGIEGICTLFDGGCELYRNNHVKRTVVIDYVDGAGSGGSVDVILSEFENADYAYAMYTQRVTSGEDPARSDMPKKVDLGDGLSAAMGTGSLYGYRHHYLLELSYVSSTEDGDAKRLKASSERVLPAIGGEILRHLPGVPQAPIAVQKLPTDHLIPLGVTYVLTNVLGVPGTGPAAIGHYRDGDKRWQMLVIAKDDVDQAKDQLTTLGKKKGASEEKNVEEGAYRLMAQEDEGAPKAEWIVARKGKLVMGTGDEPFAAKPGESAAEHEKTSLSKDDKIKRTKDALDAAK